MGVVRATTPEEREDAFDVRNEVFVEEQGVPEDLEWDEWDDRPDTVHFVAYDEDGEAVGAARLRPKEDEPGVAKVERVAVHEARRGENWGRRLMAAVEDTARDEGYTKVFLHAQAPVEAFYHRLGYETVSDVFEEAGIPHVEMEKRL